MINRIIFTLLLIGLSFQAIAQDTIIIQDNVVLNSNYSSFNNVTVVGIDGVTINNGFQYSSNGTGELIIDGDPMGIQSPDGNAPYYNPAIPGSNPRNLDLSLPVGTISGSAGVSPSGAGTYSIPINLPDAPNNMIPSIDISYNSQMDYGTLGKKWSLGGVSNISISGQSRYYDGVYLPLNENDSLCSVYWDGQRLLSIGGSGLKADTFRTEEKSNILITKEVVYYDTLFKILTPDGITMIYGNSENARMHYSDSIQFIWMLEKVYNRLGDTINYSYNIDTVKRQINLSKIEYGRGENGFLNEIQFHYIRTSNLSYTQTLNYLSIDDLLLDSISIMSNNAYFGSYGFQYDTSNNISLLKEIVQYDDDNNRYNSTKIDWESSVFDLYSTSIPKAIESGDNFEYFSGEYTGDGYDDLIAIQLDSASSSYNYYIYYGSVNGLSSSYDETGSLPRSYTNIFWSDMKTSVYQNCQQSSSSQFNRDDISYILSGDFDGDGIDELMVKIREWDALYSFLPEDLNDGFEDTFASSGFNGFESVICNYTNQILHPDSYPMSLNSGLGRIISFDEELSIRSVRLGEDSEQRPIDNYLPDLGGYGYSIIPDNGKINYYDYVNDSLIEFCEGVGGKFWGDFNADRIPDYLFQSDGDWYHSEYNFKSNSFTSHKINCKNILGTIDLNEDGTSGWVSLQKDTTFQTSVWNLFNLWCDDNCNYINNTIWNSFLTEFDLIDAYDTYSQTCLEDNFVCRYNFMNSEVIEITTGGAVYIAHLDSFGPTIVIEESVIETDGFITPKYTRSISADINSDGRNELLLFNRNLLKKIVYNFHESYENGEIEISFDTYDCDIYLFDPTRVGDFNGDGNIELISPENNSLISFISSGKPGYFVSAVTNGLGIKTDFIYSPLSDANTYSTDKKPAYPLININAPWYVVEAIVRDNGVADSDTVSYTYQGAKYHMQGKGFLGFKKITSLKHLTGNKNVSIFDFDTTYYVPFLDSSLLYTGNTLINLSNYYFRIDSIDGIQYKMLSDSSKTMNCLDNYTSTTRYCFNADGQLISNEIDVDEIASIKQTFEYTDAGWYFPSLIEKHTREYNRNGTIVADSSYLEYNSMGQLALKKDFWGSDRERITMFQNYNSFGKPLRTSVTGKMGLNLGNDSIVKTYSYSEFGRFLRSEAGPDNMKKYFDFDINTGKLIKEYLPSGIETEYQYGAFNTLEKIVSPNYIQSISKIYWADGHPDAPDGALYYSLSKNSVVNQNYTFYDTRGRELRTVRTNFNGDKIFIDALYDSKGRIWKTSLPYEYSNSPIWSINYYDNLGRIIQMISPDSTITDIVYSPLTVETTVSKGTHSTTQTIKSNALGETVQIEDVELHEVNYLYYPDGKLKSIFTNVHPSDTIQLEYDIHGNRTMINDPDAGILRSQYDDFSHLIQQITAKGDTIKYDYDKFGRMVQRLDERGNTYYIYESDSTSKAFGKIDSIYCPSEAQSINYNYESTYGRLSSVDERISGKTFTNTFSYDWFGRLMSRTYPAGLITNYSYAENGQMKEITGNGVEVWSCESTNELGQITCFTQGSYGTELEFDAYGVLDEITTGSIFNIKYIHDDAGNIASREDVLTHQKELFSYDNLNQLTKIEYYLNDNHISSSDLELAYGGDGNILSKSDLGLNINYGENTAGPHALTSIEKPVSSYVPPPQIITYTDFNKVSRIIDTIAQDTTISLEFTYGMSNQRVKSILKENNVIKKVKYFSSQFEVDSTANGIKKYNYITSPTGLAAIYVQEGTGNDTLFYTIQDHLGSISVVINQVTDSTQYFSYSSWGQPRDPDDWTLPFEGNLFSARGYTGHEHLLEFNLINMNGRIYDPAIGRFLSPDPFVQNIGNANSFNRYAYCRNNPLSYFDPSGYTYDKPLYNSDDVTWGSENSIGGSQQTPFLPRASFYDPFEYDDPFELVWIDGPNGGAYVSKSDVIIIDFEAFLNDLRSNYETDDFKLTIKLGYNGEIWIVGNNKGAQSSFGGLNTNNFLDYEVATVYATNRGDYELGKELVGVISVWSADAAYVLGVSGQYGQFKSKNGNIYRLGSLGYGVGLDAGVSYMVLGVWANPNTFSPQDLRGWSFNGNISLYVIDIGGEIPLVEKWREWGYEFGDAYIDGGAGPAIPGFGAFFGGSYTWISKKPIN